MVPKNVDFFWSEVMNKVNNNPNTQIVKNTNYDINSGFNSAIKGANMHDVLASIAQIPKQVGSIEV